MQNLMPQNLMVFKGHNYIGSVMTIYVKTVFFSALIVAIIRTLFSFIHDYMILNTVWTITKLLTTSTPNQCQIIHT